MGTHNQRVEYGKKLVELGGKNPDIVVLEADLGKSTMSCLFEEAFPDRYFEMGIAEQNMTSFAGGLALAGKIPFTNTFAVFASGRAYDQIRQSIATAKLNVKVVGSSSGMSDFGDGATHQSIDDVAIMSAIPNMRVYIPSDHLQTRELTKALLKDEKPAYVRVGRNAVNPVYEEGNVPFEMDKATFVARGGDAAIIACGEMVGPAKAAAALLEKDGIRATVLDMYCLKPLDTAAIVEAATHAKAVVTVEEHAPFGGLGSMVAQVVGRECPRRVLAMSLPDAPVVTGTSREVFDTYGLNAEGIAAKVKEALETA